MEFTLFGKQYFVNKLLAIIVILILIIGSGALGFFLKQVYLPLETPIIEENKEITAAVRTDLTVEPEKEEEIQVYVTGCVNKPGVVTIKKGQVINDAIKMAGGATKDADIENINLAYKLEENAMLRIKSKSVQNTAAPSSSGSAATKAGSARTTTAGSTTSKQSSNADTVNKMNSGVDIIKDSIDTVVGEAEAESTKNSLININKASQAELENLPNVGPATAKAIIDYRDKNGAFKKLTDIMKITGIKQKTYDKIKDYICID